MDGGVNQYNEYKPASADFLEVNEQWPSNYNELELVSPRNAILGPEDPRYGHLVTCTSQYIVDLPSSKDRTSRKTYPSRDRGIFQGADWEHNQNSQGPMYNDGYDPGSLMMPVRLISKCLLQKNFLLLFDLIIS